MTKIYKQMQSESIREGYFDVRKHSLRSKPYSGEVSSDKSKRNGGILT